MADPAVIQLIGKMEKLRSAPTLRTVNGFGFRLSGMLALPGIQDAHISAYWLVALFIPVVPLRLYVVSGQFAGPYSFYGSLTFRDVYRAYGNRTWWLLASAWLEGTAMLGILIVTIIVIFGVFTLIAR